eukprot:TRINITY_DN5871_c0_g2_i1.p1 TRINITY_DN5871_c0_g2~~TRINITY_DN5871_c0_g2_i1.p1  ORF type:complete len:408 (-),score=71.07 TRINITY_DN5871_c0_g2_i1:1-1182(-)
MMKQGIRLVDLGPQVQKFVKEIQTESRSEMSEEDKELLTFVSVKQLARVYDDIACGLSAKTIWEILRQDLIQNKIQKEGKHKEAELAQKLCPQEAEEHKRLELEAVDARARKIEEDALEQQVEAPRAFSRLGAKIETSELAPWKHACFHELAQEVHSCKPLSLEPVGPTSSNNPPPESEAITGLIAEIGSNCLPQHTDVQPELSSVTEPGGTVALSASISSPDLAVDPPNRFTHASYNDILLDREPARSAAPAYDDLVLDGPVRSAVRTDAPLPAHKVQSANRQGERLPQEWQTKRYAHLLGAIQETEAQLCVLNSKLHSAASTVFDDTLDADLQWHQSVFNHFIDLKKQLGKEEAKILKRHPNAAFGLQDTARASSLTTRVRALSQRLGGER